MTLLGFVEVLGKVWYLAAISFCSTIFVHTLLGNPEIVKTFSYGDDGVETTTLSLRHREGMIFSWLGEQLFNGYVWFAGRSYLPFNPFTPFFCVFCLNVWVSILSFVLHQSLLSLSWYWVPIVVVFSSYFVRKM